MKSTKSAIINLTETLSIQTYIAEDGNHYVTAIDINALLGFQFSSSNATKNLKALLAKDSNLVKIKPQESKILIIGISLSDFNYLLNETAFKGNQNAQSVVRALSGTTLQLLSDDAHGIAVTNETLKVTYEARAFGKVARRTLTDALKDYGYTDGFQYARLTTLCYNKLGWSEDYQSYKESGAKKFRDTLNERELRQLERLESFVERRMSQGMPPEEAILDY